MNKKGAGVIFLTVGLLLIISREVIRFLTASIFTFKLPTASNTMVENMLEYTPYPYSLIIPILFVVLGLFYLTLDLLSYKRKTST